MFKKGERLTRHCRRKRSETFTATHEFSVWSDVFDQELDAPKHIRMLYGYLGCVFIDGVPEREGSVTQLAKRDISFDTTETDLVEHCAMSKYQGWGNQQHDKVQDYLAEHDPYTIGIEVPVFDDTTNGFIDILRIHDDYTIEISDFKPKAKNAKEAPSQLWNYRRMLANILRIKPEDIVCTWFDECTAYKILSP